jgi:branched-chain amino acid transport system permease protein
VGFVFHTLVTIAIYAVLASSFDLVIGYSGQFSVAHAAFYGIGAYATAVLALDAHIPILVAALMAALVAAAFGWAVAIIAIRIGGIYLVVASLAFQMVVIATFHNVSSLGGALGIGHISHPGIFGHYITSTREYAVIYIAVAILVALFVWWLARSPFGRALQTIRENTVAAMALGKNPTYLKSWAFAIAGGIAGLAGAMYATYVTYISAESFSNDVNILIFAMVIVGGVGTVVGPVLGAVILVALPAALTFLPISPQTLGPAEQLIYGVLLVVVVAFRPEGLIGLMRVPRLPRSRRSGAAEYGAGDVPGPIR